MSWSFALAAIGASSLAIGGFGIFALSGQAAGGESGKGVLLFAVFGVAAIFVWAGLHMRWPALLALAVIVGLLCTAGLQALGFLWFPGLVKDFQLLSGEHVRHVAALFALLAGGGLAMSAVGQAFAKLRSPDD
jgi:hypothetical protein